MKLFNKIMLVLLAMVAFTACEDLETFNENPNAPAIEQASPSLILPKIIYEVGNEVTVDLGWGLGNIVMQLVATNNFTGNDIYNWGTYEGTWNLFYRNARDAQNLIVLGESLNNQNYVAMGKTIKAYIFSTLTEMYGDIPYAQALSGKSDAIFQPVYDNQQAIYTDILAEYAEANDLYNPTIAVEGDVMFGELAY